MRSCELFILRVPDLTRARSMHKNRGAKMRQLDDGIGDTLVLAPRGVPGTLPRSKPYRDMEKIRGASFHRPNTIVQLIRWSTSGLIAPSLPIRSVGRATLQNPSGENDEHYR